MLSFPLNASPSLPWASMPLGGAILRVLQPLYFIPGPLHNEAETIVYASQSLYIITVVWITVNITILGYAMYNAAQEDDFIRGVTVYRPKWPIHVLRVSARVTVIGLYIPLMYNLLHAFQCSNTNYWGNTTVQCFTGVHILYFILSLILIPLFLLFGILSATLLLNRRPDAKKNPLSQVHGRIAVAMLIVKTILCIAFVFGSQNSSNAWFLLCLALAGSVFWLIIYARYLPYHVLPLNEFQCAMGGVMLAAAASGLLAKSIDDVTNSVGAWAWIFTSPLAAFVGWAIAYVHRTSFARRRELASPFVVEIKARIMLNDLMLIHDLDMNEILTKSTSPYSYDNVDHSKPTSSIATSAEVLLMSRTSQLTDISNLYADGIGVFSGSAFLELFFSSFLGQVRKNRHLETMHLRAALAKADSTSLDIRFYVAERIALMDEEEGASNTVRTSVVRRLQFDTLFSEVDEISMHTRRSILDFWNEACEKRPDMTTLENFGTDIIASIRRGEAIFRQLLEMAPQSTLVLRSYADFLLEISNDPRKALELLQLAEQIEEDESKARTANSRAGNEGTDGKDLPFMSLAPDFDLSNENVALVRISSDPSRLGVIIDANPSALKLFGYGRREVLGKNISVVVPDPMGVAHTKFIEKFIETGEEHVINTSRVYMGLHRNGHLLTMSANVRPMDDGFGAVLEEIVSSQCHIIFQGSWGRWKVTGACKSSMAYLDIRPEDLKSGNVSAVTLIPGLVNDGSTAVNNLNSMYNVEDMQQRTEDTMDKTSSKSEENTPLVSSVTKNDNKNRYRRHNYNNHQHSDSDEHSPLMNSLLNASGSSGPGIELTLNVMRWGAAAAATARAARRGVRLNAQYIPLGSSEPDTSTALSTTLANSRNSFVNSETTELNNLRASRTVLRNVSATAKLQEIIMPFTPGALFVLRWNIARAHDAPENDMSPNPMLHKTEDHSDNKKEEDNEGNGSVDSNAVEDDSDIDRTDHNEPLSPSKLQAINRKSSFMIYEKQKKTKGKSHTEDENDTNETTKVKFVTSPTVQPEKSLKKVGSISFNDHVSEKDTEGALTSRSIKPQEDQPQSSDAKHQQHDPGISHKTLNNSPHKHSDKDQLLHHKEDQHDKSHHHQKDSSPAHPFFPLHSSSKRNIESDDSDNTPPSDTEGRNKKAASVNSGSSAGSATLTDALRRGIRERGRHMETSLIALNRALVGIFIFISAMNIATLILSNTLFASLESDIDIVRHNGLRGIALQNTYSELQRLHMMSLGYLITYDNASATKARLYKSIEDLADLHKYLYEHMDENDVNERILYSTPTITVEDLVIGTYITRSNYTSTNRTVNLANVGVEFISKARQIHNRPYDTNLMNETTGTMFWLLINGPTTIRDAFNTSMLIGDRKTMGVTSSILLANHIVLGIGLTLLLLVTACFMIPAVHGVLSQKTAVFAVFLETPLPILRSLRARSEAKITAIQRAQEEANAGLDVGGAGEADEEDYQEVEEADLAAATQAMMSAAVKSREAAAEANDPKKKGSKSAAGTTAVKKPNRKERKFKHTAHVSISTDIHFVFPVLIMVAYYIGTFFWRQSVAETSDSMTNEILAAHQIAFFIEQSNYNIRNALVYCDKDFVNDQHLRYNNLMYQLEQTQDDLLYGNEIANIRPLLKLSNQHFHLFMENGCVENSNRWYDMDSCINTFFDGLVGRGLQGAYKQYVELSLKIMDHRIQDNMDISTCQAHEVNEGAPVILEKLAERYLAAGFARSATLTVENTLDYLVFFENINILVTIGSIVALVLFYIIVYQPLIRQLDSEIKNVRYLLLLFPDEVSRIVPAIIAAGKELLKDGHVSSASSAASGASNNLRLSAHGSNSTMDRSTNSNPTSTTGGGSSVS